MNIQAFSVCLLYQHTMDIVRIISENHDIEVQVWADKLVGIYMQGEHCVNNASEVKMDFNFRTTCTIIHLPYASSASVAASISLFEEESENESKGGNNGEDDDTKVIRSSKMEP